MKTAVRERSASPERPPDRRGHRTLLMVGLVIAAFLVFFPAKQLVSQYTHIQRLETRLDALEQENERLSSEVDRLENAEELEVLARERLGLVEPGERVYLFVPSPSPEPEPAAESSGEPPLWSRIWSWFTELVRGSG